MNRNEHCLAIQIHAFDLIDKSSCSFAAICSELTISRINENGRFNRPKDNAPKEKWAKYDNDLFQTGRLITCGLYVNCVLKDYVRTILNLNRTGTKWDLDPRTEEGKTLFNSPAAEGTGNQVSAEFNLSKLLLTFFNSR